MSAIAYPKKWTPKIAQRFCEARIDKIHNVILEVAGCWGEVNNNVVWQCDVLIKEMEKLRAAVKEATDHELDRDQAADELVAQGCEQ